MKRLYYFDDKSTRFIQYNRKSYLLMTIVVSIFIGIIVGTQLTTTITKYISTSNNKMIGTPEWVDSTFQNYEKRAEIYLSKYDKSPIKPAMLRLAAHNAYDSTGVILPVELALAQAQIESSMGTKGRSPINNPFNVGEYDNGTVLYYDNTFEGIQAYYYLMCRVYLRCKDVDILFKNFTNCNGKRYASSPNYEIKVEQQFNNIQRYIDNRIYKDTRH